MRNGQVLHVLSGSGSRGVFPAIDAIAPRAVLASAPGAITLSGANLAVPDNTVLARCQGAPSSAPPVASLLNPLGVAARRPARRLPPRPRQPHRRHVWRRREVVRNRTELDQILCTGAWSCVMSKLLSRM